jgi:hypothetical protein
MASLESQNEFHPIAWYAGNFVLLNNIILLSSPWILTSARPNWDMAALYISILYAVFETACLAAFLWLRVSPELLLFTLSPNHLLSTEICQALYLPSICLRRPDSDVDRLSGHKACSDSCVTSGGDEIAHYLAGLAAG